MKDNSSFNAVLLKYNFIFEIRYISRIYFNTANLNHIIG